MLFFHAVPFCIKSQQPQPHKSPTVCGVGKQAVLLLRLVLAQTPDRPHRAFMSIILGPPLLGYICLGAERDKTRQERTKDMEIKAMKELKKEEKNERKNDTKEDIKDKKPKEKMTERTTDKNADDVEKTDLKKA